MVGWFRFSWAVLAVFVVFLGVVVFVGGLGGSISSGDLSYSTFSPPVTIPVPDSRLTVDYKKEMPAYSVEFKAEPSDYGIEFNAYDTPLRFKPVGLVADDIRIAPSLQPRLTSENNVEYRSVFGNGVDISYEMDASRLKESIIIWDEDILSSSTASIDFILTYPDYVVPSVDGIEWDGEPATMEKDIVFIRRKESHKLYAVNEFYAIKAPFLNDSSGRVVDLTYTLSVVDNKTILRINLPAGLDSLEYPVVIDPTIYLNRSNDGFMWRNNVSCGTHTDNCSYYLPTDDMEFLVPFLCTGSAVEKPLFRFITSGLSGSYGGSVNTAELYLKGPCTGQSYMHDNEFIRLYEVACIQGSPTCSKHNDANVSATLHDVMNKTYCPYSNGGWVDVTTNFKAAIGNHTNISLKIDINPVRTDNDNPGNNIKFDVNDAQLYIQYHFTCASSGDCPSTEFCKNLATDLCETDLNYGESCENVAVDNDNYACQNNNCQKDDFDGSGKYCTHNNKCIHNTNEYDPTYIHCADNQSYYKTCLSNTSWSTQTNCDYGCNETQGCATTTTTTSTTTTSTTTTTTSTTTTTQPQNIIINPATLTHRRNV